MIAFLVSGIREGLGVVSLALAVLWVPFLKGIVIFQSFSWIEAVLTVMCTSMIAFLVSGIREGLGVVGLAFAILWQWGRDSSAEEKRNDGNGTSHGWFSGRPLF